MKTQSLRTFVTALFISTFQIADAQTPCCPDTNGVKYAQYPNVASGVDVDASFAPSDFCAGGSWVLADDFPCTNSGPITDIHLWGSWLNDVVDPTASFTLAIWSDVPATPSSFSHPGTLLWTQTFTNGQYILCPYTNRLETFEDGWSLPVSDPGCANYSSTSNLYYLCFYADSANTFYQTGTAAAPTNYWLSVTVMGTNYFGWKSSATAYNDIAVGAIGTGVFPPSSSWQPVYDLNGVPIDLAFKLTTATSSCPSLQMSCFDLTIPCGAPIPTNPPSYLDPCCTNVIVTLLGSYTNNLGCTQIVSQTWQAVDTCYGVTNTCGRTITVLPSIPMLFCSDLTITCGMPLPTTPPSYFDRCCTNVTVALLRNITNRTFDPGGCSLIITQVWQAVDHCCNISNGCLRTVFVTPAPPTFLCTNLTLRCGDSSFTNPPALISLCCTDVTVSLLSSTSYSTSMCSMTVTQTWEAVDNCCGAVSTCTRAVFTTMPTPPVFTCSNLFITCGSPFPPPPFVTDACCPTGVVVTLVSSVTNFGPGRCSMAVTQTWSALDLCCGMAATCTRTVGVMPSPPTLLLAPLVLTCGDLSYTSPPPYLDVCCTNIAVTLLGSVTNMFGPCSLTITQSWRAVELCCGASTVGTRTVFIAPTPPILLCTNITLLACDTNHPETRPPSWFDPCCTNVTVTLLDVTSVASSCSLTITQTWQAFDQCCGTTSSCTRTVTRVMPPPVPYCSNLVISCGDPSFMRPPAYLDACCSNVTVTLLDVTVISGTGCSSGTMTQTWQAVDQCCGASNTCTRTVTFMPSTPVLFCSNLTIQCGSPLPPPPAAMDSCCGVTVSLLSSATNGAGCSNVITQTWWAQNCCTNSATCVRTVTVLDTIPPAIVCPSDKVVTTCGTNAIVTWTVSASDNCSLAGISSSPPSGSSFLPNTTNTVTCTAWDQCYNTNTCTFTVRVTRPTLGLLSITNLGSLMTLSWSDGILQQASNVSGPWSDVPEALPPTYSTPASAGAGFYRLRCNAP